MWIIIFSEQLQNFSMHKVISSRRGISYGKIA
jgi:hypothetical protein